jgi:hypothetical protein
MDPSSHRTSPLTKAKITTCWHHFPYGLGHYLIMQQSIFLEGGVKDGTTQLLEVGVELPSLN